MKTNDNYWDCDCYKKYIHPTSDKACPSCGTREKDQPSSRQNEIDMGIHFYSEGSALRRNILQELRDLEEDTAKQLRCYIKNRNFYQALIYEAYLGQLNRCIEIAKEASPR